MSPVPGPELHDELGRALDALRALVMWLRGGGAVVGVGLAVLGAVLLAAADRLRRPVAALGGAAVGVLAARAAQPVLPEVLSPAGWAWVAAVLCGAGAALVPALFPSLVGALVGALLGLHVPVAGRPAIGAILAAGVGAALLAIGARSTAAVLASIAGGLALGAAFVTLAGGHEIGLELALRPSVLLGLAVVLGVAGAVFQLAGEKNGRARFPQPPKLPRD
jgi:hypothetical protein